MVKLLRLEEREPRTQVEHLRALALQCGLPLPRNPRMYRGRIQSGALAIGRKSKWCALMIDAWLDGQNPPPVAAHPGTAASIPLLGRHARADMQGRAKMLAGGQ